MIEPSRIAARRDIAGDERQLRSLVVRRIAPRQCNQRRILLDTDTAHSRHARSQAQQRRTRTATALQHALTRLRRNRRRQQHRLDAAAKAAARLRMAHAPAKQMISRLCEPIDRKSTRLNSSHPSISYAVFCLKKKKHNKE